MGYGSAAIRITDVTSVPYWATGSANSAYLLDYSELINGQPSGRWLNLCSNPDPESPEDLTMANGLAYYSLMFEGDRLHRDTKTITADDAFKWFTIACSGGAPAKLYLTGHAYPASYDGFTTTRDERQTMLKMFVADYCGGGTPYTVAGQPLTWADSNHWMEMLDSKTTLEARWGPDGAVCIGTPRASVDGTPAAIEFLPTIIDTKWIVNACGGVVPACNDPSFHFDGIVQDLIARTASGRDSSAELPSS